jgi:methionyl-tRNA formyltransferase
MRIVLIGQAAFAEKVLDGICARGHEVAAVYCPPDPENGKIDPVKTRGLDLRLTVRQHRALKSAEVREEFAALDADLGVLAYVTQIVPPAVFNAPRLGSICFHPSLLPRYRGGSAIPWQIIKGETRTGATVFWTDEGIDTGPILLQKEAAVGPDDTGGSLYYDTLFPLGVEAVLESIDLVAAGNPPRAPQDDSIATYDPLCRDEHAEVDWRKETADVYNLIRGCDPQPGAYTRRGATLLRLYGASRESAMRAEPGIVSAIDERGVVVGTEDGAVRIGRMRAAGKKAPAQEVAAEVELKIGAPLAS